MSQDQIASSMMQCKEYQKFLAMVIPNPMYHSYSEMHYHQTVKIPFGKLLK